jgi:PAS domain S-box-containing protein
MPMPGRPSQLRLFLERFLPLTFIIMLVAGGFWLVEQHSHQQLLSGTAIGINPEQAKHLLALFNAHQAESIGGVTMLALLVAALTAWYGADIQRRRMLVEQQNREQLRKIELLLNSTVEGIYAVDCSGNCIMANRSCAQMLGYHAPADLLGQQMHTLVHHTRADGSPYTLEQCKAHQIIATGAVASASDEIFWRRDGSALPVSYTAHPIRDDEQIIGMVCTFVDLTGQKQAEAKLGDLQEQLRQAQKMEAIGQLASGVAHDFNNILQVISGNAQLLELTDSIEPPLLQSRLAEIVKAVERGINLTRAMLAFARRQAIALRPLELNQLLQETEPLARNLLNKQQHLNLQLHPAPLTVIADATLLQQVLFNLVTNARDAMPDGGSVTIGTRLSDQAAEQLSGNEPHVDKYYAVLWVQDTGHGISEEIRNKVFEPFFTTKPVGKGTGLGLAMIYGTIKQHKGFVRIESEPGIGSTISVYLPYRPETVQHL